MGVISLIDTVNVLYVTIGEGEELPEGGLEAIQQRTDVGPVDKPAMVTFANETQLAEVFNERTYTLLRVIRKNLSRRATAPSRTVLVGGASSSDQMPTVTNDGVELRYETAGSGPTVAFVNPVGYGAWCWSWLVDAISGPLETLVWDLRGTGRSDAPPGPYDVETLAADLDAVLATHGTRTVHLVGAGLGGMIALAYARERGRAATLTLLGTAAEGSRVDADALADLAAPLDNPDTLRESLRGAFSAGVVDDHPDIVDRIVDWRAEDDAEPAGWDAQAAAMTGFDVSDALYEITTPALVCHGRDDDVVPFEAGNDLADGLPRGECQPIDAGHLVAAEEPTTVEDALLAFLDEHADLSI